MVVVMKLRAPYQVISVADEQLTFSRKVGIVAVFWTVTHTVKW
jgi:DMSO/TMAO reductase YedYZ heme-binding membrane subunit